MSKLINEPESYVDDVIDGIVATTPGKVRRIDGTPLLVQTDVPQDDRVHVVTGGGAGHEPASAGLVGPGLLDGVALGEVFTAPSATKLADLIAECDSGSGVLSIIANYEGDVMNFEGAMELVGARHDIETESVIVADDVATKHTDRGGRGVCGMVIVCKVAGAKAEREGSLDEVASTARKAADNVATVGVGVSPCRRPGENEPMFELEEDTIEIGIGNHGEAGIERTTMMDADEIVDRLTEEVLADLELEPGDSVATMVNGMGATPMGELYIVNNALQEILDTEGLETERSWVGNYTTSLDMRGCSIVVMKLDDELTSLINAGADTPGLAVPDIRR